MTPNTDSVAVLLAMRSVFDTIPPPCAERDALDAAIAALEAQAGEWVLVPREPTQAMLDANGESAFPAGKEWLERDARSTWAAMLAAAPSPASRPEAQGEAFGYAMEYPHAMPTTAYIHAPEFVKRLTRAEQLRDECEREFGEPAKITPLYLHPTPPGADAVTEGRPTDAEIAREFWKRWTLTQLHVEAAHELQRMHDAVLAARTGKGESDGR